MSTAGFEYKKKKDETPFETFLRYTDEKEKSAAKLAALLQQVLHERSHVLDVGTGNGEYLQRALAKTELPAGVTLHLVEPSNDLFEQLEHRFRQTFPGARLHATNTDLQGFVTAQRFDVIVMSHLFYHIPRASWTEQLARALSLLRPDGVLIVVLREHDDAYDFKMAFKPLLFGKAFKALTLDDVLAALPERSQLQVTRHVAASTLVVPLQKSLDDTIAIIEFYLNKPWDEMPASVQKSALAFMRNKNGTLRQLDGIAVIKKQDR